ncbi:hypothetical protein [Mesorhizobium sp. RMAD-H1]|uniref:hypothetical protein n=1 Tax=Mesorhizobium sp. RMAD-H1 TaxID=2587065 RepID=UPI0016125A3E|nr:hypothetical protein [Mesorhizobium sp. RMAD-H1]MBB2969773.1 hypothetical protein [Mesorhizobium sp. RMAD-H1]
MDAAVNTDAWLPVELINIGLAGALFFFCLGFSFWRALNDRRHPVYWRTAAALIWVGVVTIAFAGSRPDVWTILLNAGWIMLISGMVATLLRAGVMFYQHLHSGSARRPGAPSRKI